MEFQVDVSMQWSSIVYASLQSMATLFITTLYATYKLVAYVIVISTRFPITTAVWAAGSTLAWHSIDDDTDSE